MSDKPSRRSGGRDHHDADRKKVGDRVPTPSPAARDMIDYFKPNGIIMDPCRGDGAFYNLLPSGALWCEIDDGVDFLADLRRSNWIIGNPPYNLTRIFMRHAFRLTDNVVFLVPARNIFAGYGTVREAHAFGGLKALRWYGTGGSLGFPMGNGIAAFHWERAYRGPIHESFFEDRLIRERQFQGARR